MAGRQEGRCSSGPHWVKVIVRSVTTSLRVYVVFFQAEDGIRDVAVTGVQTCALPISLGISPFFHSGRLETLHRHEWKNGDMPRVVCPDANSEVPWHTSTRDRQCPCMEIGRASCRERV